MVKCQGRRQGCRKAHLQIHAVRARVAQKGQTPTCIRIGKLLEQRWAKRCKIILKTRKLISCKLITVLPSTASLFSFIISWKKKKVHIKKDTEIRFLTGFTFKKENSLVCNHYNLWYNTCILLLFLWIIVFHLIHNDECQQSSDAALS